MIYNRYLYPTTMFFALFVKFLLLLMAIISELVS